MSQAGTTPPAAATPRRPGWYWGVIRNTSDYRQIEVKQDDHGLYSNQFGPANKWERWAVDNDRIRWLPSVRDCPYCGAGSADMGAGLVMFACGTVESRRARNCKAENAPPEPKPTALSQLAERLAAGIMGTCDTMTISVMGTEVAELSRELVIERCARILEDANVNLHNVG